MSTVQTMFDAVEGWKAKTQEFMASISKTRKVDASEGLYVDCAEGLAEIDTLLLSLRNAVTKVTAERTGLGREHNRRLAMHKLPPEILGMIFKSAVQTEGRGVAASALGIAAVCSHWRYVALRCLALWSTIDFKTMKPGRVDLYYKRSNGHPLTLLSCDIFSNEFAREFFVSHLCVIESVDIVTSNGFLRRERAADPIFILLNTIPTSEYPRLKRFSCDLNSPYQGLLPRVLETPFVGKQTPSLRHVTFVGVRLPWNSGFYSNLLTLEIRRCPTGKQSAQDDEICHVLRDCPRLQNLHLALGDDLIRDDCKDILYPHTPADCISMRFLRSLTLTGPISFVHHILSSTVTDSLIEVHVTVMACKAEQAAILLSLPMVMPQSVFPRLDILDIYQAQTDTYERGHLKCYDSEENSDITSTPVFNLAWRVETDAASNVVNERILNLLSLRMVPHMKSLVSQNLLFSTRRAITYRDISKLLRVFALGSTTRSANRLTQENCPDMSPEPQQHITKVQDSYKLEELSLASCTLTLEATYVMVEWCKRQSSLRKLRFICVDFRIYTVYDLQSLSRKIRELMLEIEVEGSNYRCSDGSMGDFIYTQ